MMNHFDTQPVGWADTPEFKAELEGFRRTKEKMDRERNAREAAERKIKDEQDAKEQARLKSVQQAKEALPYSDELAQEVCERIAVGELLINVCLEEHLPTMRRCNQWMREHTEFAQLYQSAINDRVNVFEEQVILIADDMRHDFRTVIKNGQEKRVPDPEMVARAKLRIEVRFRHLKAGRPAKWGDVSTLNVKNADSIRRTSALMSLSVKSRILSEKVESERREGGRNRCTPQSSV
jgi:hypothetical protein